MSLISSRVDLGFLLVDPLEELILVGLGWLDFSVLADSSLQLAVNLKLSKSDLLLRAMSDVENTTVILATNVAPH